MYKNIEVYLLAPRERERENANNIKQKDVIFCIHDISVSNFVYL